MVYTEFVVGLDTLSLCGVHRVCRRPGYIIVMWCTQSLSSAWIDYRYVVYTEFVVGLDTLSLCGVHRVCGRPRCIIVMWCTQSLSSA